MMKWWKILFWAVIAIVILVTIFLAWNGALVKAATNISATSSEKLVWDDVDGWWNFYDADTVVVRGSRLEGYATSSVGDMSLDCFTTSVGNICGSSNYGICNGPGPHSADGTCSSGDASGILTGYAWNDTIGWISFNCDQTSHGDSNTCASSDYKVSINSSDGIFSGYAWNDIAGWMSVNCAGPGVCGDSNYKVVTAWRATSSVGTLVSATFDTQVQGGAILNSILWKGEQPTNTCVKFQIAVSNASDGPWTYYGPGEDTTQYFGGTCPGPDQLIGITGTDRAWVNNQRYLRYKIFLTSNLTQTQTPTVNDVILNWSK